MRDSTSAPASDESPRETQAKE